MRPTLAVLEERQLLSTFTVTNTQDDATGSVVGSLRWAVTRTNATAGADTINFDSNIFNTPQTIKLSFGQLSLTDRSTTSIVGPGAGLLTVDGQLLSRDFSVTGGAVISNLTIANGKADFAGGVLNDGGTLTMNECVVSGNTSRSDGGGLYGRNNASSTLNDVTVNGNIAGSGGGGITSQSGATFNLTNATVTGNSATTGGGFNNYGGNLKLVNSTVSGNSSTSAGGIFTYLGTVKLTNTIVAGQTKGGDVTGVVDSTSANNLIGNGAGLAGIANGSRGNLVGTAAKPIDPLLGTLGNDGGPTPTLPLKAGSPAINAGTATGVPTTDQRGFTRVGTTDIGSFEFQNASILVNSLNDAFSGPRGQLTLRAAVNLAAGLNAGDTVGFDPSLLGTSPRTFVLNAGPIVISGSGTTKIAAPTLGSIAISGGNASRVFTILSGASAQLTNLKIINGQADQGGAIFNAGTLNVTNSVFTNNAARVGGALFNTGKATFDTTLFSANSASSGGGAIDNGSEPVTGVAAGSTATLTLNNCDVAANQATPTDSTSTAPTSGGAILNQASGNLTITGGHLRSNIAGGINFSIGGAVSNFGTATIDHCDMSGNSLLHSSGGGGAIDNQPSGSLSLSNCTISNNIAQFGSGIFNRGNMSAVDCSITGNVSTNLSLSSGGGLDNRGTATLIDCTISANGAVSGGGVFAAGTTTFLNCTITNNLTLFQFGSFGTGGGILIPKGFSTDGPVNVTNTIVTGNQFGDIVDDGHNLSGSFNLVGDGTGQTVFVSQFNGNIVGTTVQPIDPHLGPLGTYGGPTLTMPLLPGSPAIDAGTTDSRATTDQRGTGRFRATDIGAFESHGFVLTSVTGSTPQHAPALSTFAQPLALTIVANNSAEPVDGGIVIFNPPAAGQSAHMSSATPTIVDGRVSVTASSNNYAGSYSVNASASPADFTSFSLTNDTGLNPLVVTTTLDIVNPDDGVTSLREAVAAANARPGADTITFDPTVFSTSQEIDLTLGELVFTDNAQTTLSGPGAALVTVRGGFLRDTGQLLRFRVFRVNTGASAAVSGLTVTGGQAQSGSDPLNPLTSPDRFYGGGLLNNGNATFTQCSFVANTANFGGGGVSNFGSGTLILNICTFTANGAAIGGAVENFGAGTVIVNGCTIRGNNGTAVDNTTSGSILLTSSEISGNQNLGGELGGGLANEDAGTMTVSDCSIFGNTGTTGAGIYNGRLGMLKVQGGVVSNNIQRVINVGVTNGGGLLNAGSATLTNVTIAGNTTVDAGGGIENTASASLTLNSCSVSGNTASNGGGIDNAGIALLIDTTVANNLANSAGGLLNHDGGQLFLNSCTVSGNTTQSSLGAVFNDGGLNSPNGFHLSTSLSLKNTIIAGNINGELVNFLGVLVGSSNLIGFETNVQIGNPSIVNGVSGNQVGTSSQPLNPLLAPLGNYGGPTATMPLLPGSPAIDCGEVDFRLATDQRGFGRVGNFDIGAFESQGFTVQLDSASPRKAIRGTTFINPLLIDIIANNRLEPVNGGVIQLSTPGTGPSASLSAPQASIAGGRATVSATANSQIGSYPLTVKTSGLPDTQLLLANTPALVQLAVKFGGQTFVVTPNSRDLPWSNIQSIQLTFDGDISTLALADFSLVGTAFGNYLAGATMKVDAASKTVTLTLAPTAVIGSDPWTAKVGKTGDHLTLGYLGTARNFAVLPGDFDGNGVVNLTDILAITRAPGATYNIFADLNGDGVIDASDLALAKKWAGSTLR